jgi:cholera toxin transcriptional activator
MRTLIRNFYYGIRRLRKNPGLTGSMLERLLIWQKSKDSSTLPKANQALIVMIVSAAIMIPVRAFVISLVLFHAPRARDKFLKIWPFLLLLDELWSLSPFLLLHHISFGLALSCTALLVYSPFAQRSLVLMGAGMAGGEIRAAVS